jgi:hypothetical protein
MMITQNREQSRITEGDEEPARSFLFYNKTRFVFINQVSQRAQLAGLESAGQLFQQNHLSRCIKIGQVPQRTDVSGETVPEAGKPDR